LIPRGQAWQRFTADYVVVAMADHPKPSVDNAPETATETDPETRDDEPTAEEQQKLDEALEMSFPASDPIAI
jgi:hypothetical protein